MTLLAVDPGLDVTGVAVFDVANLPSFIGWNTLATRLVDSGSIKTTPKQQLGERIGDLANGLIELVKTHAVLWVAIEQPAIAGVYGERVGRQWGKQPVNGAAMAKLNQALGALIAAAELQGCKVMLIPAPKIPKKHRTLMVNTVWPRLGRSNEDQRDAIYLGGVTILDSRRRWTQ